MTHKRVPYHVQFQFQGALKRESVLYVVITADLDHTVCYKLRLLLKTLCVYIKTKKALIYWDKDS